MANPTATKRRPSSGTKSATTETWSYLPQTISVYQITILIATLHFHDSLSSFLSLQHYSSYLSNQSQIHRNKTHNSNSRLDMGYTPQTSYCTVFSVFQSFHAFYTIMTFLFKHTCQQCFTIIRRGIFVQNKEKLLLLDILAQHSSPAPIGFSPRKEPGGGEGGSTDMNLTNHTPQYSAEFKTGRIMPPYRQISSW